MGLIYDGVRIAQRSANTPQPQGKPKEWQPVTKLIWLVAVFGVLIALGGAWRIGAFVAMGLVVASVLCVFIWALGHHKPAEKDPVADYLDAVLGGKDEEG